jgi:hypothetical protein
MAMTSGQIPRYVKHVTMAILRDRRVRSFEDALDVARARLVQLGYLAAGSDKGEPSNMKLTSAGAKKNREFGRRPMRKLLEFDKLYMKSKWAGSDLSMREAGAKSKD